MKVQNAFRRGFTLIELMIVIVILGILMGTILPRLTGAQARARDTARIADLNNIAQALEVYFNDNGQYPTEGGCLTETAGAANATNTAASLGDYLKGGEVIQPASAAQISNGCTGSYFYAPVEKDGVDNAAYVLVSDVETFQTANFDLDGGTIASDGSEVYNAGDGSGVSEQITDITTETDPATDSVYVVIP